MLAVVVLTAGLIAKADKGIEVSVEGEGGYVFTIVCHYEPEQYGEVTKIELGDGNILRFPPEIVLYGDTFPVTRAAKMEYIADMRWATGHWYPKVLDLSNLRVYRDGGNERLEFRLYLTDTTLENIIFSESADTISGPFGSVAMEQINLKNLKSFGSLGAANWVRTPRDVFALRSVKMSPYITTLMGSMFASCLHLEEVDLSNIVEVGESALALTGLKNIILPKVETVGGYAFARSLVERLELNSNVRSVSFSSISDCPNLKSADFHDADIRLPENNFHYTRKIPIIDKFRGITIDSLEYLSSSKLEYLGCFHANLKTNLPSLISIGNQFSEDPTVISRSHLNLSIEGLPNLKEIYLGNSTIDKLEIGDSLIFRFIEKTAWCPIYLPNSVIDKVVIPDGNKNFYVKDSLLYIRKPPRGYDGLMGESRGTFESIRGNQIIGYSKDVLGPFGDIAIATVGYPRGVWFTPRNIPKTRNYIYKDFAPVPTYCCDYVDKIMLPQDCDPSSFRLNTYAREGNRPIEVYLNLSPSKTNDILECCVSPLMRFIVPKGMLGRFIANGFPADRLTESTDETLGLETISADSAGGVRKGTFDISGRRIPEGAALAPGMYIIDGRKTIVR